DCLIADLGIDPARSGLQTYEATYFFLRRPPVDPHAVLVLLQVGMLGERGGAATESVAHRFRLLVDHLVEQYGAERQAILYEASPYPGTAPDVDRFALGDGRARSPSVMATLCVPGERWHPVDPEARRALELNGRCAREHRVIHAPLPRRPCCPWPRRAGALGARRRRRRLRPRPLGGH